MPPHRPPAAILIQTDRPHPDKQQHLAHQFAEQRGFRVIGLCFRWPDCVAMVVNNTVRAVISALDLGDEARDAIEDAGGEVHVVRSTDEPVRPRRDVPALAVRMHNAGIGLAEIAKILGVSISGVRRALNRRRRTRDE